MATNTFTWKGFFIRFVFAVLLVFLSYNPSGFSFFHWAKEALFSDAIALSPSFAMSAVVLIIGWTVYIRATLRSLGRFGLTLAFAFFATLVWWLVDIGLFSVDNLSVLTYITLLLLAAILATGMSWSHIRRKMSGQADVDEVDN